MNGWLPTIFFGLDMGAGGDAPATGPLLFGTGGVYAPGGTTGGTYAPGGTSGGVYTPGGTDGGIVG